MTTIQKASNSQLRLSGLLLVAPPFIAITTVVWGVITEAGAGTTDVTTISQAVQFVAQFRAAWVVSWLLSFMFVLSACLGLVILARVLIGTKARLLAMVGLLSAIGALALWAWVSYLNVGLIADIDNLPPFVGGQSVSSIGALIGFKYERAAMISLSLSVAAISLGLFGSGMLRRTGLVIGLLTALVFTLAVLRIGLPPVVSLLLALPVGIGLLRRPQT